MKNYVFNSQSLNVEKLSNDEILTLINKCRLESKNEWYLISIMFTDCEIAIKGYKTWLQRFTINGRSCENGICEQKVKEYKEHISKMLDLHL